MGRGLDVEWRHRPGDGFVDVDAVAGDAALAVDAGDVVGTGARVTVDSVLAGSAVETPSNGKETDTSATVQQVRQFQNIPQYGERNETGFERLFSHFGNGGSAQSSYRYWQRSP